MIGLAITIALQAASAPPVGAVPQSFSILEPVASEPCTRADGSGDVVVCADPLPSQTLPYPLEIVPDHAVASNPDRSGTGALAAESTPCAAMMKGCTVGFGGPVVEAAMAEAVVIARDLFRERYPKAGRVPIPID